MLASSVTYIFVQIKSDQLQEDLIKTLKEEVTFDFTRTLFDAVVSFF